MFCVGDHDMSEWVHWVPVNDEEESLLVYQGVGLVLMDVRLQVIHMRVINMKSFYAVM